MSNSNSVFTVEAHFPLANEHDIKSDGQDLNGLNILLAHKDNDTRDLFASYLTHWSASTTTTNDITKILPLAQKALYGPVASLPNRPQMVWNHHHHRRRRRCQNWSCRVSCRWSWSCPTALAVIFVWSPSFAT